MADQVCRRNKQGLKLYFRDLADPIASARHLTLSEGEAQGSWLPLLPGATIAAGILLTDTLSQPDEKGCRPGASRVARVEEDRWAYSHPAKGQMLWTVVEPKNIPTDSGTQEAGEGLLGPGGEAKCWALGHTASFVWFWCWDVAQWSRAYSISF